MLSYRHAFHAGNHADVLKHLILIEIAQYMAEKPALNLNLLYNYCKIFFRFGRKF